MATGRTVVVVGAGVGGVAAAGALSAAGVKVTWIDPTFTAGAFARYRDVPANTKISLLAPHFENLVPQGVTAAARDALDALKSSAYTLRLPSDPDAGLGWCGLDAVGSVLSAMSRPGYLPAVQTVVGTVIGVQREAKGGWLVQHQTEGGAVEALRAESVVLSTGCVPVAAPSALLPRHWAHAEGGEAAAAAVRVIPLEEALQVELLQEHLRAAGGGVVGVVGGGHSGVVLVRALLALPGVPGVRLFIRRPIELAQWSPELGKYDAWGFRGLKGAAAELALEHGLVGAPPPNGPAGGKDARLELWDVGALATDPRAAAGLRSVVFCVGYERGPLPPIVTADGAAATVTGCEPTTGGLLASGDAPLPGLYGAGIAFAEDEDSSGAPYPEASLKAFAARAQVIAADVVLRAT